MLSFIMLIFASSTLYAIIFMGIIVSFVLLCAKLLFVIRKTRFFAT